MLGTAVRSISTAQRRSLWLHRKGSLSDEILQRPPAQGPAIADCWSELQVLRRSLDDT